MIKITLIDGNILEFENSVSGYDIAKKISSSLAKNAFAVYVNQEVWDLHRLIDFDAKVEIITNKNVDVLLPILRHDMAHLLAEAVVELFPNTKLAIGPATENGFFYDFLPTEPFREEYLPLIEKKMKEIIDRKEEITRRVISKKDAIEIYKKLDQTFKVEIIEDIEDQTVTFYKQGDFDELCIGPHVDNTKKIPKSFKLTKVSGVYWRGDANQPMLQRIYGVGFLTEKELQSYLSLQEELEQNDHRKLGKELGLFHMQEEAVGSVFWHEKGWKIYKTLENYIREKLTKHNYKEVRTPFLLNKSLWEKSGHWEKFASNMFVVDDKEDMLALKPMNCPAHIEIFKQGQKSYRDLPYRMAEFGGCHRNEPSGSLHGLMRVRSFTQDDAHIFCTEDQMVSETINFCNMLQEVYKEIFGHIPITVKFSDRPEQRVGSDEIWDKSESSLWKAVKEAGLDPILNKGEGAFYGPKLEFAIKDSLGRDWQLGTLQSDFVLAERLGATYVGEDGEKHTPVVLHRAILGSLERFIGILLEHYKGRLPLWLAPVQVCVMTIVNKVDGYGEEVTKTLNDNNIHAIFDNRYQKINYKIREHTLNKIPLLIILGNKEESERQVTLRIFGQEKQMTISLLECVDLIQKSIHKKEKELII